MTIREIYKESFDKLASHGMSELHAEDITATLSNSQPVNATKKHLKRPAIMLAAALCILLAGTTVFTAVNGFFTRGLSAFFNADTDMRQMLLDAGLVTIFDASDAITVESVTIQPTVMLTDGGRLYLAFKVKDYDTGEYRRPEFSEHVEVSIYDGEDLKTDCCTGGAMGFYSDVIPGEGEAIGVNNSLDFGIPWGEYYDSEHNLEYIINVGAERPTFGQTVHVVFSGISAYNSERKAGSEPLESLTGTYWAANTIEGPWVFDLKIPERSDKADALLRSSHPVNNEAIWKGVYIDSIDITPLRIFVNARATKEAETIRYYHIDGWYDYDRTGVKVTKIRLKSGEVIDYSNDRIIDPREIDAVYIKEQAQKFSGDIIGEENYYEEEQQIEIN